jgi:hypothetical protein
MLPGKKKLLFNKNTFLEREIKSPFRGWGLL